MTRPLSNTGSNDAYRFIDRIVGELQKLLNGKARLPERHFLDFITYKRSSRCQRHFFNFSGNAVILMNQYGRY